MGISLQYMFAPPLPFFPPAMTFLLGMLLGFMLAFPIIAFLIKSRIIECVCQWKDDNDHA